MKKTPPHARIFIESSSIFIDDRRGVKRDDRARL